jgi:hypothetical protein
LPEYQALSGNLQALWVQRFEALSRLIAFGVEQVSENNDCLAIEITEEV